MRWKPPKVMAMRAWGEKSNCNEMGGVEKLPFDSEKTSAKGKVKGVATWVRAMKPAMRNAQPR